MLTSFKIRDRADRSRYLETRAGLKGGEFKGGCYPFDGPTFCAEVALPDGIYLFTAFDNRKPGCPVHICAEVHPDPVADWAAGTAQS